MKQQCLGIWVRNRKFYFRGDGGRKSRTGILFHGLRCDRSNTLATRGAVSNISTAITSIIPSVNLRVKANGENKMSQRMLANIHA